MRVIVRPNIDVAQAGVTVENCILGMSVIERTPGNAKQVCHRSVKGYEASNRCGI